MMKNAAVSEKKINTKKQKKLRRLKLRRRIAMGCGVAAVVLAVLAWRALPSLAASIWGLSAAALALLAGLLCLRLELPAPLYAILGGLCLVLAAMGITGLNFVPTDMGYLPKEALMTELTVTDAYPAYLPAMRSLQTLDMRGSTVTDFQPLKALTSLRTLDVRENDAFTLTVHDDLAAALPMCDILWSVPAGDGTFDSTSTDVDLNGLNVSTAELQSLRARFPDERFNYTVEVQGHSIPWDAESVDLSCLSDINPDEIAGLVALLPYAREIDLRGTPVSAEVIQAVSALSDARFMFSCLVPVGAMTTEDAEVTIPGGSFDELQTWMSFIDYMPNLTAMDARAILLTKDQFATLRDDPRSAKLILNFTVFGVPVNSLATELNLDNIAIPSAQAVEEVLAQLPRVTRVSMCNCGLSDDDMAGLCDRHPDIKFVFVIKFGHYTLRTDATAFTTNLFDGNYYHYGSGTFRMLQYCTDLMMLDIGHCELTNISALAKLKKLRVLILADNKISDISPLAELDDLEYVELFLNDISDLSPLANKAKLLDLNLFYNPIGDIRPLYTLSSLERLWVGQCKLSDGQIYNLKTHLPGAKVVATGTSSTGEGWRSHKRYTVIKDMYKKSEYIPFS